MNFELPSPGLACFDMGGVLHHARYLELLEKGRELFFIELGYPYPKLVENGFHLAVIRAEQEFLKPISYGIELECQMEVLSIHRKKLEISSEIRAKEECLHRATTVHISVKKAPTGFSTASLPEDFTKALGLHCRK